MNIRLISVVALLGVFFAFVNVHADDNASLQVNSSVSLKVGETVQLTVSNASENVSAKANEQSIVGVSYTRGKLSLKGLKAGSTTVEVKDRRSSRTIFVTVVTAVGLSVSPMSITMLAGETARISLANAAGTVSARSSNTSIVTVTYANSAVTVKGLAVGNTSVTIRDSKTSKAVAVTVTPKAALTVNPTSLALNVGGTSGITVTGASGAVTATSNNPSAATVTYANGIATVKGVSAGNASISIKDTLVTKTISVTIVSSSVSASGYTLLAWNDLGMHCMDGLDYSIFAILPPYNSLHAQLKDKAGQLVSSGVTLTYEAVADSTGSINTYSAPRPNDPNSVYKTNFWDKIGSMLGLPPNTPPKNIGLNLDGMLSGAPAPGNPAPSSTPAALTYNTGYGWWEAEGIPITPIDDAGHKNFYPTVKVVAKDFTGKLLATTTTVLPVSDEMTCKACHATTTSNNAAANAAKPSAGWSNDPDPDKDWKKNILRLHDERKLASKLYQDAIVAKGYNPAGLLATAEAGKPILCVACHLSYAYTDKAAGDTVMKGFTDTDGTSIRAYTQVLHSKHAAVKDPTTDSALDDINNRTSCYLCHPGSETQCLRGAMSQAVDPSGKQMSCQSCHGNLTAVGHADRKGWLEEPTCQACHNKDISNGRGFKAVDANGKSIMPADKTFATNDNKPLAGLNLYRFSTGHGGLQCEACHGPTHAEYPSTHLDENAQSKAVQGHEGTISECTACHTNVPSTVNGGPHGMHSTGNAWVSAHEHANKNGTATTPSCAYCHGTTSAGTPLSEIKVAKTINAGDFGTKNWSAGYRVSCYSCHNGPNPD